MRRGDLCLVAWGYHDDVGGEVLPGEAHLALGSCS
jgi:hypothetical protein